MQLGYKVSKCIITESRIFLQEYFEGINVIITTSP
jgi:hypothetical protein